jgi:hypothetical protein
MLRSLAGALTLTLSRSERGPQRGTRYLAWAITKSTSV